jgi:glutathione S-transferase
MRLVIGDKNLSSWSLRPWVLMKHAGIPFTEDLRRFDTPGWRDDIDEASPSKRVPALHDGELVIWESLAIGEHLAERFPEKQLWPADPTARSIARAVSCEMHAGFSAMRSELSMEVMARHPARKRSRECDADVARVQAIWTDCRARFGKRGPFLFGSFSIADAMFAPVAYRFRTYSIAMTPVVQAWVDAMLELPAMQEWERGAAAEVAAGHEDLPAASSAAHVYAVIFTSHRTDSAGEEYARANAAMDELAKKQPGFLGIESARGADGFGITVSYWSSLEAIRAWGEDPRHRGIQARARETFYDRYSVRVASVERSSEWKK